MSRTKQDRGKPAGPGIWGNPLWKSEVKVVWEKSHVRVVAEQTLVESQCFQRAGKWAGSCGLCKGFDYILKALNIGEGIISQFYEI